VRVRGFDFDVRDEGDRSGEAVVLLHGFPAYAGSWDRLTPGLIEAGYRVVRPDQRGYSPGARPTGRRAYAGGELAADVLAILDELGLDRVHLVGHDWGGSVAWRIGATAPDRLRTLTAVSTPHPAALVHSFVSSLQGLRSWYMGAAQLPQVPERLLLASGGAPLLRALRRSGLPAATAEDYVARMREPGALAAALNWYRAIAYDRDGAGRVTTPTLYVWGTGDSFLGRAAAEDTARFVTGPYTFLPLDGAGHWIPEVEPERLLQPLLAHLRT
jgi:pimeloyl-ACP methyl ester carboxylesterase